VDKHPTSDVDTPCWYLVRTKQYKERWVQENLGPIVDDSFLPIARTQINRWGRRIETLAPLFPSYLFVRFDLLKGFYKVQRTLGVIGLVCTGMEPAEVDPAIIAEIRSRSNNGVVEIKGRDLRPGESVFITGGPLCGLEAVFESYMSGTERVAVLLASVRAHVRVVLPAAQVAGR
jgi:transcriptional antiterminator RfaH